MKFSNICLATVFAAALAFPAVAQQQPGFFVPGGGGGQPARPAAPRPAAPAVSTPAPQQPGAVAQQPAAPQPEIPIPQLEALPKVAPPPAAVIGVIGVPEIMRASTAAQAIEREIGARRTRLNEEAAREQQAWRDAQQALANDRARLSPEQLRTRERQLQERVNNAQRIFRERNQVIQEAAQKAMGEVERMLIAVIRQVSDSHGMNLVLHRSQVALNVNDFDISEEIATQLNKLLTTVTVPPEPPAQPLTTPAPPAASTPAAPAPGGRPARSGR